MTTRTGTGALPSLLTWFLSCFICSQTCSNAELARKPRVLGIDAGEAGSLQAAPRAYVSHLWEGLCSHCSAR